MKKNLLFALLIFLFTPNIGFSQTNDQVQYIPLQGDHLFPESILKLPNNDILVGGIGDGSIQKLDINNNVSYFKNPGEDGLKSTLGIAADQKRNRLWVLNLNLKTASGYPGSNIKIFDLTTGKLIKTISENYVVGAFFNEIILDDNGVAYISNTIGPDIYTANFDSSEAKVFVKNDLLTNSDPNQPLALNGLTITPNKKYLIASVMHRFMPGKGRLVRINIATKEVDAIVIKDEDDTAARAFAGSDNMWFYNQQLFMINVYSKAGAIITAKFNKDYSIVTLKIRSKFQSIYDRPTGSTIRGGKLYTVNSQLNHIVDDKDGKLNTPPVLPFNIVSVSLNELMK
ncbi:MAG TPA: hypothetical protein VK705_02185 [Ferruginibacter sp.]|jgi:hypothetical protein|nr:hypothetical protein [Ferruginibacter sp.]